MFAGEVARRKSRPSFVSYFRLRFEFLCVTFGGCQVTYRKHDDARCTSQDGRLIDLPLSLSLLKLMCNEPSLVQRSVTEQRHSTTSISEEECYEKVKRRHWPLYLRLRGWQCELTISSVEMPPVQCNYVLLTA